MNLKSVFPILFLFAFISCSESSDEETSTTTDSVIYSVEISAASGGAVDNSGGISILNNGVGNKDATSGSGVAFIFQSSY